MDILMEIQQILGSSYILKVNPHKYVSNLEQPKTVQEYLLAYWSDFLYNTGAEEQKMIDTDTILQCSFKTSEGYFLTVSAQSLVDLLIKVKSVLKVRPLKKENPALFSDIDIQCCSPDVDVCFCGGEEAVLRMYTSGNPPRPMTDEERSWCVDQADWAGQGQYTQEGLEELNDKDLAYTTLCAWSEYANSF